MISLYFTLKGTRLGAITAALIGWITLAFSLIDIIYAALGHLFITSSQIVPNTTMRSLIGFIVAAGVVVTSHNVFYKIGACRQA